MRWPVLSLLAMELLLGEHARDSLARHALRSAHLLLLLLLLQQQLLLLLALHDKPVALACKLGHFGVAVRNRRDVNLLLRLRHAHHEIFTSAGIGPAALHELHKEFCLRVGRGHVRAKTAWAPARRTSARMAFLAGCLLLALEQELLNHLLGAG